MAKQSIRLMTLDPGHFHAALVHGARYRDVSDDADVYAPLGMDLVDHLRRVTRFNTRSKDPTAWRIEVHAGSDFLARMKKERPGNVVVISGRNKNKIDYIHESIRAGFHVLSDKPCILRSEQLPKLKATLDLAQKTGRIFRDLMTERHEDTTILQKALVIDPEVFGQVVPGTPDDPGVVMQSVHHLMKVVAGVPNIRPAWYFDVDQQGQGLNDIGTHLVDMAAWTLFPGQPIDPARDVKLGSASRWPTWMTEAQFARVTGESAFPDYLKKNMRAGKLEYFCNTALQYALRGVHIKFNIFWDWEPPPGQGDTHFASYRGDRSRIEVRQGRAEKGRSELYVVPVSGKNRASVVASVHRRMAGLQATFPGVAAVERGEELLITFPDKLRTIHEQHFASIAREFFDWIKRPRTLPAWEKTNMHAKYWVTTRGTDLSHAGQVKVAPRLAPT